MIVVLMGVSGSGKTTIGKLLAERTGWVFADADDYFPVAYKQKMAAGHPLNDEDRAPWLLELNKVLRRWDKDGTDGILACSALKAKYHQMLEAGVPLAHIRFIFLDGPKKLIAERLATRKHEFMNPVLLESQLATLETPTDAFRVLNDRSPAEIVDQIMVFLAAPAELDGQQISK